MYFHYYEKTLDSMQEYIEPSKKKSNSSYNTILSGYCHYNPSPIFLNKVYISREIECNLNQPPCKIPLPNIATHVQFMKNFIAPKLKLKLA